MVAVVITVTEEMIGALPIGIILVILVISLPPEDRTLRDWIGRNSDVRPVYCLIFLQLVGRENFKSINERTLICVRNPPFGDMQYLRFCTRCNASSHDIW